MKASQNSNRAVLRISGSDNRKFLGDMVTNALDGLAEGAVYAALLTPQGKYLFDFFLIADGPDILLDVAADRAQALAMRLNMYKLRADVQVHTTDLQVFLGQGEPPAGALDDPRDPALGWRLYATDAPDASLFTQDEYDALRVAHLVPETGIELIPDDTYILEAGFERLHGVDFRKGCYVGQEVTARMKHKTELKKGLARVSVSGDVPVGTEITANGKPAGVLYTTANGQGIAYLRFDRAAGEMQAGTAILKRLDT